MTAGKIRIQQSRRAARIQDAGWAILAAVLIFGMIHIGLLVLEWAMR